MRPLFIASTLFTLALVTPGSAQSSRAPAGFDFNACFSQCLNRGGSPGSCQPGCADRAAALARIPPGAPRSGNNDPRSPRYYDPEPRQGFY